MRRACNARRVEDESLATEDPALVLRPLAHHDVERYYALVDRNRSHLTRHGDFEFYREATVEDVRAQFVERAGHILRFGVWYSGELIGRLDLNPIDPPRWALGYWLDERFTGRGLMTAACKGAIGHARTFGATEVYAGVRDGNARSVRLLRRLGFEHLQDVQGRSRWRLPLTPDPPEPFMVSPAASA